MDDDSDDILITVNTCTIDGKVYGNLDRIPNDDPCKLCHCQFGVQVCAERDCAVPVGFENCTPLEKPAGKCCPEEFECSKCNHCSKIYYSVPIYLKCRGNV